MSRTHDRFEELAGALALGEASDAERAELAAHAQTCSACALDLRDLPIALDVIRAARESERWQPGASDEVRTRLREGRERGTRRTLITLGYGIAASLVLNVAFVSGFGARALDALRVTPGTAYAASTRITLERRPRAALLAQPAARAVVATVVARRPAARLPVLRPRGPRSPAHALAAPPEPPDAFGGLAIDGAYVAGVTADERCAGSRPREVAAEGDAEPCPATPAAALLR